MICPKSRHGLAFFFTSLFDVWHATSDHKTTESEMNQMYKYLEQQRAASKAKNRPGTGTDNNLPAEDAGGDEEDRFLEAMLARMPRNFHSFYGQASAYIFKSPHLSRGRGLKKKRPEIIRRDFGSVYHDVPISGVFKS